MIIRKAFQYRTYLTAHQESLISRFCGCARFVWNKALALQLGRLEGKVPLLQYGDLAKLLTLWRSSEEYGFLAEGPVHTQQWTLKFLQQAIWEGLDKKNPKKFPQFRKKGRHDSLRFPDSKQIGFDFRERDAEGRNLLPQVFLPKLGFIKMQMSREIKGVVKNVTISRRGKHWYTSIQTEQEVADPICESNSIVGIDLGIIRFATLATDTILEEVIEPLEMKGIEKKISWEQRKLSRKKKFSVNWKKQKIAIQKVFTKKANILRDFQHKHSTLISKNHAIVVMEDLKVANMSASAKGTIEEPGRNVKAKSGLNKAILRQGWYAFRQMLKYKLEWNGGKLILVSPRNTSIECPKCYCTDKANRKSQSEFVCIGCNYRGNADQVGATNVLRAGHAQLACCF